MIVTGFVFFKVHIYIGLYFHLKFGILYWNAVLCIVKGIFKKWVGGLRDFYSFNNWEFFTFVPGIHGIGSNFVRLHLSNFPQFRAQSVYLRLIESLHVHKLWYCRKKQFKERQIYFSRNLTVLYFSLFLVPFLLTMVHIAMLI